MKFKRNFELGTTGGVVATEAVGDMPIRNFLGGRWTEKAERISGQWSPTDRRSSRNG